MAIAQVSAHRLARLLGTWHHGDGTSADKLACGLRELITKGRISAGSRLPSERHFASTIGLARTTVGHAFSLLRDEGSLTSRTGVGTFISSSGRSAGARGDARLQSFLEHAPEGRMDLRCAADVALPMVPEELGRLSAGDFVALTDTHGYIPEGLPELRAAIASYYCADGLPTAPDEIVVTAGAQQAAHIVTKSLLDVGDLVIVEEPTFRGGLETLRSVGARLIGVPSGEDGVDVERLGEVMERYKPKMALLQSTVHNPTGSSMSDSKRSEIGSLAEQHGVTLVDDASNSDTLVLPHRPKPLAACASRAITIGSASKLFWGGLRIGWIRADRQLLDGIVAVKNAEDLGTSMPSQVVAARLLARVDEARAWRCERLTAACQQTLKTLRTLLPDWQVHPTTGGASFWIKLPDGHSATVFAEQARRSGVDVLAGPTFSAANGCDDHLRLTFSGKNDTIVQGLARLAATWDAGSR